MDRILQALLEDDAFSLVTFENQPQGKDSIPDAEIRTGSAIWIETKTKSNAVNSNQLRNHLNAVGPRESLLLLTPDEKAPTDLDDRVAWSSFGTLVGAIQDILSDESDPPSEKEAFLLREFILMLKQDGLLDSSEARVIVFAAKSAWPMYELLSVYRCSLNKPMRAIREGNDHVAFYSHGMVHHLAPKIMSVVDSIDMSRPEEITLLQDDYQKKLAVELRDRIDHHHQQREYGLGLSFKVMFLTGPNDSETVKLDHPIINDKTDKNGKPTPFTYGQPRYVTLKSLKAAAKTSDLEFC